MPSTSAELAKFLNVPLEGNPDARISSISSPESAAPDALIYAESEKFAPRAQRSRALCVIAPASLTFTNKTILRSDSPKLAFAKAAAWLLPVAWPTAGVHPTAIVAPTARLAAGVSVGPYAVIEDEAVIETGAHIGAFCFIGAHSSIGAHSRLHPRVTLYPKVTLGQRVIIHSGSVIGADGFGYVHGEGRHWKFPQIGTVEIADDVEIGANTTIDRGSLGITRIATGVKIDNLVQVAHNVQIGEHSIVAAQTGISGSSVLGHHVICGGQVGIADRVHIQDGAILGAQAGIPTGKTIRVGETVWGTPARRIDKFKEQYGWLSRLPNLAKKISKLSAPGLEKA